MCWIAADAVAPCRAGELYHQPSDLEDYPESLSEDSVDSGEEYQGDDAGPPQGRRREGGRQSGRQSRQRRRLRRQAVRECSRFYIGGFGQRGLVHQAVRAG